MKVNSFSVLILSFAVLYFLYSTTTPNFQTSAICVISLLIIYKLFGNQNPLFLYAGLMMQWLSMSVDVFYSNSIGVTLADKISTHNLGSGIPDLMDYTLLLNHYGLLCYAIGLRIMVQNSGRNYLQILSNNYDSYRIIQMYAAFNGVILILSRFLSLSSGFAQFINFLVTLKWGIFFAMIYVSLQQKKSLVVMFLIVVFEILLGFISYFSNSFANVFIFLFLAFMATGIKLKPKVLIPAIIIGGVAFYIMLIWTSIKGDYRNYLNQGSNRQVVSVDKGQALRKFSELASKVDQSTLEAGWVKLVNRIGYIAYFSNTIDYIPARRPHENGKVYFNAFTYYFKPRLFFPDKKALDDSEHTREYTGIFVSGKESGTSISLGYIPDAYVDFGPILMCLPLIFLGICTGALYNYFENLRIPPFWTVVMLAPFFFLTNINGTNADKAIGPLLIHAVFGLITVRFLVSTLDARIRKKAP